MAQNEDLILPTILSRTQLVKIPLLGNQDVEAALELNEGVAPEKARQAAAVAEGNYREALRYCSMPTMIGKRCSGMAQRGDQNRAGTGKMD